MKPIQQLFVAVIPLLFMAGTASAHDPVFSPGPHVLYKEGVDLHLGADREKAEAENWCFGGVELTVRDFRIGIHIGFLIYPANTFDGANIEGIL